MLSHFHLHRELKFPGVMGRHNGPPGLREDDDDYYDCENCDSIKILLALTRKILLRKYLDKSEIISKSHLLSLP